MSGLADIGFCFVKPAFENSLRKTIKRGDIDEISSKLTPRALTKCNKNALLMAMEVGKMCSCPKAFIYIFKYPANRVPIPSQL